MEEEQAQLIHERAVGDTLSKFAVQLTREGVPIDLSPYTIKFMMSDKKTGVIKVPETQATSSNALLGYAEYDFSAPNVDTVGEYKGFFVIYDNNGERESWPADDNGIKVIIFSKSPVETEILGISPDDFLDIASAPRRVRTIEGTVEERSVDDLIKADRYLKSSQNENIPWGIRVARTKPPGTT